MRSTVFLLTAGKNMELSVRSCIGDKLDIYCVTKGNLMVELYKKNPQILIVDIDSYGENTLDMIESILSIEYLPVVYVYSGSPVLLPEITENEVVIPVERLRDSIIPLIKQATVFKEKYDNVMESFNAIDLLNGEVKSLLKKYVYMEGTERRGMIKELLDLIFAHNIFLQNKPRFIWVLYSREDVYKALMFERECNEFVAKAGIDIDKEDGFEFDIYASNGFCKNFNVKNEVSDISFSGKVLPRAIKKHTARIENFAGFAIGDLVFIGINYNSLVTNYDVTVIKALTINYDLIETIKYQMDELEGAFEYTTNALARAAEVSDDTTGKHIKRVNAFAKRLAEELGMGREFIKEIYTAAQMHDVGKIYIDKAIIGKPGKLTDEEFEKIKSHTIYGEKIIGNSEYLKMAAEIARCHHERYDGTGYPDGKKGDEIPMSARITFLADIYDALRSERPYKPGFSHEKTCEIILKGDGRVMPEHFDPTILETFKKIHNDFESIYEELKD